jgi:hypothetical protein
VAGVVDTCMSFVEGDPATLVFATWDSLLGAALVVHVDAWLW